MNLASCLRPLVLLALFACPLAAQAGDLDDCRSTGSIGNEARLKACNAVIDGKQATGADLAAAYYRRGAVSALIPGADPASVMADFDKAIELDPAFTEAYTLRGLTLSHEMKLDAAIADYSKAISLSPGRWSLYYLRGMAYGQKQDFRDGLTDYREALAHDPPAESADVIRQHIAQFEKKLAP